MMRLGCLVFPPLQPHRVWRQWRGGRRYRGDWGSKNWPGKIILHVYDIMKYSNAVKMNWKLILIYSQTEQAGAEQLVGHKANTRMPTDGLTNSISRFFFNSTSYDLYNCGFEISIFIMDTSPQFLEKDRPLLRRLQTGAVETPDNYSYHGLACIFSNCHSGCAWTWNVNKSRNLWNRQCVSLRIKVRLYIGYTRSVLWCL